MIIPLLLVTIACVVHDGAASQPDIVSEYLYRGGYLSIVWRCGPLILLSASKF